MVEAWVQVRGEPVPVQCGRAPFHDVPFSKVPFFKAPIRQAFIGGDFGLQPIIPSL